MWSDHPTSVFEIFFKYGIEFKLHSLILAGYAETQCKKLNLMFLFSSFIILRTLSTSLLLLLPVEIKISFFFVINFFNKFSHKISYEEILKKSTYGASKSTDSKSNGVQPNLIFFFLSQVLS